MRVGALRQGGVMRGPIDYIIVKFNKPQFEGKIIEELQKSVEAGTIAVLGLSVIAHQPDGVIQEISIDDKGALFESLSLGSNSFIDEDDIREVGSLLEPDSAAGVLVIEHLWAIGLKQAIEETGGALIAEGRIHPEAAYEIELADKEGK